VASFTLTEKMHYRDRKDINNFYIVGINYKKTDTTIRGSFAINDEQYQKILDLAPSHNLRGFFVLSTCNRTEIYGFAEYPEQLMEIMCSQCEGNVETFKESSYIKNGWGAIEHLYHVSAGLDSQILGDYEILGQIKKAAKFAKDNNNICPFMERLVNSVVQSSKAVKTNTLLSSGTVSVSFAAAQYIKENINDAANKNILLVGTGKIGRNTCKNLVDYLNTTNITLVNRTVEKAANLAKELGLQSASYNNLAQEIDKADVILVATNSNEPTILKHHLENKGSKLIIDLSVPSNVAADAATLSNITFIDVDGLSKIKDETLQKRKAEVPKAITIIKEHIADFKEWHDMRKHVPMLMLVKVKLQEIQKNSDETLIDDETDHEEKIQKVINSLATKMRRNNTTGCYYIEAINEFIA